MMEPTKSRELQCKYCTSKLVGLYALFFDDPQQLKAHVLKEHPESTRAKMYGAEEEYNASNT